MFGIAVQWTYEPKNMFIVIICSKNAKALDFYKITEVVFESHQNGKVDGPFLPSAMLNV